MFLFDSKCARQSFPSAIYHLIINWIVSFTLISHHVKLMLTIQKITANLYRHIWIFNRIDSFPNPSFTSPLDPIQKIKSPFLFNHNRLFHNKLFISRITIVSNQFDNSNFLRIDMIHKFVIVLFFLLTLKPGASPAKSKNYFQIFSQNPLLKSKSRRQPTVTQ